MTSGLSPEFGGPARTVPALSFALAELGHHIDLVYLDFGHRFQKPLLLEHQNLVYHPIKVELSLGLRPVLTPSFRKQIYQVAEGKRNLIFHDNGIWHPHSGVTIRTANMFRAPILTTVHGMLEPWALSYGRFRKSLVWNLFQKRRLEQNQLLHTTSQAEAENLRKLGLSVPLALIPNGTTVPEQDIPQETDQDQKTILFLSRIHPKKGLLNLVEALRRLQPAGWRVLIAGYDEGGHKAKIEQSVRSAGLENMIRFIGPVDDQDKWQHYNNADLFVLPSYSENFGIVVIEALAVGTPVLTTKGTPWRELVEYNCGWWVEPTVEGILEGLKDAFSLNDQQLRYMGSKGRKLVRNRYSWQSIAADFELVYNWLLGRANSKPNVVIGEEERPGMGELKQ